MAFLRGERTVKNINYIFLVLAFTTHAEEADFATARAAMVDEVRFYATLARDTGEVALNEDILDTS